MCPSPGLWESLRLCFPVYHPGSTIQLWRSVSVCFFLYLLTRAHCARSPSIPLWLASHLLAPAGGRTQSPVCAFRIPVSHDRWRAYLFFVLVQQAFRAWCRRRFQQPPRSPTTKLICSNSHFGAAFLSATMMLLWCSFASASHTSRDPSSLSVDRWNSKIYTICAASSIATFLVACPTNNPWTPKDA